MKRLLPLVILLLLLPNPARSQVASRGGRQTIGPGFAGTTLSLSGKATSYNGTTTAGQGLASVYGAVSLAAQTAAVSTANLVASAPSGQYQITVYLPSTVVCATPGPAQAVLTLGWTDETGARTQTVTQALGTTTGLSNTVIPVWVNGAATNITYATALTACTSGTATYALRLTATQLQ